MSAQRSGHLENKASEAFQNLIDYLWNMSDTDLLNAWEGVGASNLLDELPANLDLLQERVWEIKAQALESELKP